MEVRQKRAKAVRILGREFNAIGRAVAGTSKKQDTANIWARSEVAVMTTMAKAQGQDLSEQDTEELIRQAKSMKQQQSDANKPKAVASSHDSWGRGPIVRCVYCTIGFQQSCVEQK